MNVRDAMGVLHRQGQLDLDYWLCQVCGYANHSKSRVCRGYLDLPYSRWRGEVEPDVIRIENMRPEDKAEEIIKVSNASFYNGGLVGDAERWSEIRMSSEMFNPIGTRDGCWVVPCNATQGEAFGGRFMDTSGGGGLTRTGAILATQRRYRAMMADSPECVYFDTGEEDNMEHILYRCPA